MLKLKNIAFYYRTTNLGPADSTWLEHIATGWDRKDIFLHQCKILVKEYLSWVDVSMGGCFLGKNSNGSFLLQLDGCLLGFQLRAHIVKCCISIIWSELLGNWEISSGTLKTTIAMVKLIFFRRKDICVTTHSLLR